MTEDRMLPNVNVRPGSKVNGCSEATKPELVTEQSPQNQANAAAQLGIHATPPRTPLFRH